MTWECRDETAKPTIMNTVLLALEQTFQASRLERVDDAHLSQHDIELWIKRDDQLHPIISGNKWRKLKYLVNHALELNAHTLISMGGAYSNHLHALGFVGKMLGLQTVGYVRGERPSTLTPTLQDLQDWGMDLRFISRSDYRQLRHYQHWQALPDLKARQYWLPEGGAQPLALQGVAEMIHEIDRPYDWLCVPCGTGTSLAGMIQAAPKTVQLLGFAALNHAEFLRTDIAKLIANPFYNWQVNLDYHFGGFAKTTPTLLQFMTTFQQRTGIPLEPIYTGKMLYGIYDLIAKHYFPLGTKIIAIHTGGLQGNRGLHHE